MDKKISLILCDLDEVLVDFVGGACRVHGVDRGKLEELRHEMGWGMEAPLSKLLGRPITLSQFWKPIKELGEGFWLGLESLPWKYELMDCIKSLDVEWLIVTSPSLDPLSYSGKVKYMRRMFGPTFGRFVVTPYKHLMADRGVLLIDDRPENVEKFIEHGGEGLIFPSHGNQFYPWANDPVPFIRDILKEMVKCI